MREPADKKQCQAEKRIGSAWSLGGVPEFKRCTEKPVVIAYEIQPGDDGEKGSMSLCSDCMNKFKSQMGTEGYKFEKISVAA